MMGRESRAIGVLVCACVVACAIAAVPYVARAVKTVSRRMDAAARRGHAEESA